MIILRLYISGAYQYPDIILNSSVQTGSYVFVDQVITMNCTSTGSQFLLWESDEYIGYHMQISLTSEKVITGDEHLKSGSVSFVDVQSTGSEGQTQISSKFRLVILPDYEVFTIKCRNGDHGSQANVTYHLSGMH